VVNKSAVDDLISIADAARLRGVTHGAIRDLIDRGRLNSVEVAGRRLVSRVDVEAFEPEKGGRPSSKKGGKK
jgi:excisionase family DNA binding protein